MNELTNMRQFALLSEPSQTESNEQMECAYGNFVEHIEAVSSSGEYANIHRTLNITRIELAALENIHRYEQGGKCPEKTVSTKSLIFS